MNKVSARTDGNSVYREGLETLAVETDLPALPIEGRLPSWLSGRLLRTAPCEFEVNGRSYRHWFDGLAMLHGFQFGKNGISYRNRFLQSRSFCEARRSGKISRSEFATDPCYSLFGRVVSWFAPQMTDNGNVNIDQFAADTVAMTETRLPIRFDPETLATLGVLDEGRQPGETASGPLSTAHPHFDAARKRHYNYAVNFARRSTYQLFSVDQVTGRQSVVAELKADRPAYMHSFGMTEKYLVLAEFPLTVNPLRLKFRRRPFIENYFWTPERGLRLHVVEKDSGKVVRQAETDPLFAFHHVNAFERDSEICIDLIAYPDASVIAHLYLDRLRSEQASVTTGTLTRIRISVNDNAPAATEQLFPERVELPRLHYDRVAGKPYRYTYCAGNLSRLGEPDFINSLVKLDLDRGNVLRWTSPGCFPGEPVFVPAPAEAAEDAGVAISVVFDADQHQSFLLILDAQDWRELARARIPHVIPFGFHGSFFPAAVSG